MRKSTRWYLIVKPDGNTAGYLKIPKHTPNPQVGDEVNITIEGEELETSVISQTNEIRIRGPISHFVTIYCLEMHEGLSNEDDMSKWLSTLKEDVQP